MDEALAVHDFKVPDLHGGTLIVSIPNLGVASILYTDYLLEQHRMDHVASLDSLFLPTVAMILEGKPRFPLRIHASAQKRLAILRSELPIDPDLTREVAGAALDWAEHHGLARVLTLDSAWSVRKSSPLVHVGVRETAGRLKALGVPAMGAGALAGVTGGILLESRLRSLDIAAIIACRSEEDEDLGVAVSFATTVGKLVEGAEVDAKGLRKEMRAIDEAVRKVRVEAEHAIQDAAHSAPAPHELI